MIDLWIKTKIALNIPKER